MIDKSIFNWVQVIKKDPDIPSLAKYLGLYLGTFMNAEHDTAWPSLRRIEHETGLAHATVLKHLKVLEDMGYLFKTKKGVKGQQQNEYHANLTDQIIYKMVGQEVAYISGGRSGGDPQVGQEVTYQVGQELTTNNNTNNKIITRPPVSPPTGDGIPTEEIRLLFNSILPECKSVRHILGKRLRHLTARWKSGDMDTLEDWEEYFRYVRKSPFLMGKVKPRNGDKPFMVSFDWLINQHNMIKVIEETYHD